MHMNWKHIKLWPTETQLCYKNINKSCYGKQQNLVEDAYQSRAYGELNG